LGEETDRTELERLGFWNGMDDDSFPAGGHVRKGQRREEYEAKNKASVGSLPDSPKNASRDPIFTS
jgi:hypothetical protein